MFVENHSPSDSGRTVWMVSFDSMGNDLFDKNVPNVQDIQYAGVKWPLRLIYFNIIVW